MNTAPEPLADGPVIPRRPATVTAAGWVMLVASVLGGIASAAAVAVLLRDLATGAIVMWRLEMPGQLTGFAAAVVGCLLTISVWKGSRPARDWALCLGGVVAIATATRTGYTLVHGVSYLFEGDPDQAFSLLALSALTLVSCAVAVTVIVLLSGRSATEWFQPRPPATAVDTTSSTGTAPTADAANTRTLLAIVAGLLVVKTLVDVIGMLTGWRIPATEIAVYLVGRVLTLLIQLSVVGLAISGRSSLSRAAAFAVFGYACYLGPLVFLSSTVSGWFGSPSSVVVLLSYIALLVVGILGLRLLLRDNVSRHQPPMAPDPRRQPDPNV